MIFLDQTVIHFLPCSSADRAKMERGNVLYITMYRPLIYFYRLRRFSVEERVMRDTLTSRQSYKTI
jgi:hypothetical protein